MRSDSENLTSKETSVEERRRFPRLKLNVDVEYKIPENVSVKRKESINKAIFQNRSRDISPLGICIETNKSIGDKTLIDLTIKFPEKPVRALGSVRWSRLDESSGKYFTGLEFVAIRDNNLDVFTQNIARFYMDKYKDPKLGNQKNLKDILTDFFSKKLL